MKALVKQYILSSVKIREALLTHDFGSIKGYIEQIQSVANQLESSLEDFRDLDRAKKETRSLEKQIKELEKKKAELEELPST
jgi:cell shape-determining protein MreC